MTERLRAAFARLSAGFSIDPKWLLTPDWSVDILHQTAIARVYESVD